MLHLGQHGDRLIHRIGQPLDGDAALTALHTGIAGLGQQAGAGLLGDAGGQFQRLGADRLVAQQDHHLLAGFQRLGGGQDGGLVGLGALRDRRHRRDAGTLFPGGVGRRDQRGDLARRGARGGNRVGGIAGDGGGAGGGLHPVRIRLCRAFDIGGQRGVILHVIGGMLADDVDHRAARLLGVVQIGDAVAQPRPEMQQRRGRLVGHAGIAVRRTGRHALEQAQHATHAIDPVEGGNEVHFRGAGIGEADIDSARLQGPHQTFSAVHDGFFRDYSEMAGIRGNAPPDAGQVANEIDIQPCFYRKGNSRPAEALRQCNTTQHEDQRQRVVELEALAQDQHRQQC